jgi:hypothetical protein
VRNCLKRLQIKSSTSIAQRKHYTRQRPAGGFYLLQNTQGETIFIFNRRGVEIPFKEGPLSDAA